ncbi:MAG: helix-turn-helix domain-containing protein [Alphaproteobacteria bacterium]|nr:helix-turn-helix domain-containing protein [Alphaproteobacteria bacterium]
MRDEEEAYSLFIVESGLVAYQKLSFDGKRSIFKLSFAGDLVDPGGLVLGCQDITAQALNQVVAHEYPAKSVLELVKTNPRICFALLKYISYDNRICMNWLIAMARLNAYERVGYFLMEIYTKLNALGQTDDNTFVLPMNQAILADLAGMHEVHINRVLRKLETDGYIERSANKVRIVAPECLADLVGFKPTTVDP